MGIYEAFIYGAIQGITEYLPISSSAHLILLPHFLGKQDPGLTFDVFLHLGTLFATVVYFWRDWLRIMAQVPVLERMVRADAPPEVSWKWIVLATIPALIAGALMHRWVATTLRGPMVLAVTLTVGGVLLYLVDHFWPRSKSLPELGWKDALGVGVAQCFALIPGISRSGATITGGRFLGFDRAAAARFSFLISAPITLAAVVFELRHWEALLSSEIGAGPLLVAGLSSFIFGMLAIGGLLKMVKHFGYFSFAVYRCALALVVWNFLVN